MDPDGGEVGRVAVGVRGAGGVQDQGAHVAEVGHPAEQAQRVHEPFGRRLPAVQGDAQHRPGPAGQVARGEVGGRAVRQARVADRGHLGAPGEPAGHGQGVGAVLPHPQRQRLQALLEEEGVERGDGRAQARGDDGAGVGDVGALAVGLPPAAAAEQRRRLLEVRVQARTGDDVLRDDDRPAERGAVPGEELARRVHDDVGAVLDRAQQIRRREGRVHDQRHPVRVGDRGDPGDVEDDVGRVAHRLPEQGARGRAEQRAPGVEVGRVVDEVHLDAEAGEVLHEQPPRPLVDRSGRQQVVAGAQQRQQGDAHRGLAAPTTTASAPPSSRASRRSSAATVGLPMRVYV